LAASFGSAAEGDNFCQTILFSLRGMNSRQTWFWITLAAVLFAGIYFFHRHKSGVAAEGPKVLPELNLAAVTSIQVRPDAPLQLGIRAERTNGSWQLTQPISYPARATNVTRLLAALSGLRVATFISPDELRPPRNPDEEYGFLNPKASIIIHQGDYRLHLLAGALTAPGDQVYVQVAGRQGIYVTDAEWLKAVPSSVNDWRDTALVRSDLGSFDRLAVTNGGRAFILQRAADHTWRMVWPLSSARADNSRIEEGLARLQALQVQQFVSEDPKAELERFGLAPASIDIALGHGTNTQILLQFGTNVPLSAAQVYARYADTPSIFTVDSDALAPWRTGSVNDFRDPHLLSITEPVTSVTLRGESSFTVQRQTNSSWQVLPESFPADPDLVHDLLSTLESMQITQFTKDVVNPPDLPEFGLGKPARKVIVQGAPTNAASAATNCLIAELDFGIVTNQPDKVFARRADESSVYAIGTNEFNKLPSHGWQLRERNFWKFSETNIAGVVIRQHGKTRELVRKGDHQWGFAAGSQGIINDLAVEETVRGLGRTPAAAWAGLGEGALNAFGFAANDYQITLKFTDGKTLEMKFGGEAPSNNRYAAVTLDGRPWVLELSWYLYRDVAAYLSIP
jgi:hypothetical protein